MSLAQSQKESLAMEGKEYVRVPSKSSLCKLDYCVWVLEYDDGKLIPEDVLFSFGILKRVGNKTYALKDIVDKLRVYGIYNRGSRRHPEYVVDLVCYADGKCEEDLESKELNEKFMKYHSLWNDALKTAVYHKVVLAEPTVERRDVNRWRVSFGDVSIEYRDMGRYRVVNVYAGKNKPLKDFIESEIYGILSKYGFEKGKYGGFIVRGMLKKEDLDLLIKEVIDMLERNKKFIEDALNKKRYEEYIVVKKSIEDARRELGLPIIDAESREANVPANRARRPNCDSNTRLPGANEPIPPICMPMLAKLANPHNT